MTRVDDKRRSEGLAKAAPPVARDGSPRPSVAGGTADRFRRVLGGLQREEPRLGPLRRMATSETVGFHRSRLDVDDARTADPVADLDSDDDQPPPPEEHAVRGTDGAPARLPLTTIWRDDGDRPADAPASAQPPVESGNKGDGLPDWARDAAHIVATLCSRADPAFQTWTVTLPMNPEKLPNTELRLHLSPYELVLRFRTASSLSAAIVSAHRSQLEGLLETLPSLPPCIDVDLE